MTRAPIATTESADEAAAQSADVLFDAVYGPDIVSHGVAGDSTTVPSAVVVALFAFLGTWVVAKYGFRHDAERA